MVHDNAPAHRQSDDDPTGEFRPAPDAAPFAFASEPEGDAGSPTRQAWRRFLGWSQFFMAGGIMLLLVLPITLAVLRWEFGRAVLTIVGIMALWCMVGAAVVRASLAGLRKAMEGEYEERRRRMETSGGYSAGDFLRRSAFFFRRSAGARDDLPPGYWAEARVIDEDGGGDGDGDGDDGNKEGGGRNAGEE